ncbi:hypothetical protein ABIA38_005170 [Embleya sp. AB8]
MPGETAGHASSRALGVSSGSGFGPEERVGAGVGCETRHGHRPPGAAAGTTAPDRESGDADQGGNGHVVDGQQRMRSTKQRPRPRRGRATTRRWPPPRVGPAERTRGQPHTSPTPRRQAANRPRPRVGGCRPGWQRPRSGRATTDAKHQAKTPAPEGTSNDEAAATRHDPAPPNGPGANPTPAQPHDAKPPTAPATTTQAAPGKSSHPTDAQRHSAGRRARVGHVAPRPRPHGHEAGEPSVAGAAARACPAPVARRTCGAAMSRPRLRPMSGCVPGCCLVARQQGCLRFALAARLVRATPLSVARR